MEWLLLRTQMPSKSVSSVFDSVYLHTPNTSRNLKIEAFWVAASSNGPLDTYKNST